MGCVSKDNKLKGRRGAHKMNLLKVIRKDLSVRGVDDEDGRGYHLLHMRNQKDIDYLRALAEKREKWREVYFCRTVLRTNDTYQIKAASPI